MTLLPLQPGLFQGAQRRAPYFEGWYYKMQAPDGRIFALIPGISLSGDRHAFLQIVADGASACLRYPLSEFRWVPDRLALRLGGSAFTENEVCLRTPLWEGDVRFTEPVPFSRHRITTGIMGPLALVPGLQCRHGVLTARSGLSGFLRPSGGGEVRLDGGCGYIEKDWGSAFPEAYVWVHAFLKDGASFMLSAASVPFAGRTISGLAAFLYQKGRLRRFTTYGGARLQTLAPTGRGAEISVLFPRGLLALSLTPERPVELAAPDGAGMGRTVRESTGGTLALRLEDRAGRVLFEDVSGFASIELYGAIRTLAGGSGSRM